MDDRDGTRHRLSHALRALRLSFRARLIAAVVAITVVVLGAALAAIYVMVSASERGQLDASLILEAREEAGEIARRSGRSLVIEQGDGPVADDTGPLTQYAALYDREGGLLDATSSFQGEPPQISDLPDALGEPFDAVIGEETVRAVLVPVPEVQGARLLLAAPRRYLDRDERFLWRTLVVVLIGAGVWATLMATGVMWRLTRHHQAIAQVAQQVARGDLSARVATAGAAGETGQLVTDINEMIARLEALVTSQQRFIAYASHELRSPLSVLYGELSLALRKPRDAAEYRAAIEEALDSTRHLKQLAEDLLTLARVANSYRDTARQLSVPELVQAAARAASPPRHEGSWLSADLAASEVRGVERDLRRLFVNLLDNAARYTPAGKRVYVRARAQDDRVLVWIADQGPGIAASERERIFEPFYRGEKDQASSATGAGLGLTIVREIARSHGGSVRVADAEERDPAWGREGACFVVELPRVRGEGLRALSA